MDVGLDCVGAVPGELRAQARLSDLRQAAAQAGQLVQVGGDGAVEVDAARPRDLMLGEIPPAAVLAVLAPG